MPAARRLSRMKTIYKYPLELSSTINSVVMPKEARCLTVQWQDTSLYLWAEVDLDMPTQMYGIHIVGTGWEWELPVHAGRYINSILLDGFVWHFYEDQANPCGIK